ncbi:MAG: acyl-CoA dehydrogenase family protein [Acidimicrobiales bacterium]
MRFAFTGQQTDFRDAVRQFLTNKCTPDDLRVAFDAPAARTARWSALAEMGVVGLTVPETLGGLGLGLVDLVPLLEESGRAGLPEPLVETTALAAPLVAAFESDRSATWLEGIAAGEVAAAVGPVGVHRVACGEVRREACGEVRREACGVGTKVIEAVPAADGADLLMLHTPSGIHAVRGADVSVTPVSSLDPTRRLGTVTWEPSPGTLVASGETAHAAWSVLADRASVATAAELLGLADRMITMAADYSKDRRQFGKPIGSFQAVKHLLAGAQVKLEFARPAVFAAAWALDNRALPETDHGVPHSCRYTSLVPDSARSASLAKAYASDAATEAARVSLQVHGAIGYTWECDLHLYLKRTWALAESWGSAAEHRNRILSSLMDELHQPLA